MRFPKKHAASGREVDRAGLAVRVTSLERTLVDVLDRTDLSGGWEEIWRSLEMVEFFDLDVVIHPAVRECDHGRQGGLRPGAADR